MKFLKIFIVCISTLFLFSCGEKKEEESQKVEQIFYTVMPKQNYNLDIQNYSKNERALLTQLFEGLTELKVDGVKFVSVLDIKHSEDFKEWTFILRDDLKWSDGEKITAETYLKSWLSTLSVENTNNELLRMYVIKGAEDFHNKKIDKNSVAIQAKDYELKVTLNRSVKNFDEWVSNPIFFPIREENKNLKNEEKIVNGAFKVSKSTDNEIILTKNENYWDSINTKLKEVKVSLAENEIMAYEMFPRYEIDYFGSPFYDVPYDRLKQLNSLPEKIQFNTVKYYYISIPNETKEKFFNNKDFRKLMYAVSDPEFMGKEILENNSPAIFSHPHPTSDIINASKEEFEKIKDKEKIVFPELPYVAFYNGSLVEKRLLLSTVKEWISNFKVPIRVTASSDSPITFKIEKYLLGTNNKEDFYYFLNKKYGFNISSEEEFLENLPVIPLLQENDSVLAHSNVRGLHLTPNGDIYLKYINME